jgi:hypothetical protein
MRVTILLTKWWCDGSSGHSEYKQVFHDENIDDSKMFLAPIEPLRLCQKNDQSIVTWTNKAPSSTRSCRLVQFQFMKETTEVTKNEIARMESEIANLNETVICLNNST